MIVIALALLLILVFLFNQKHFIFSLMLFFLLFDMFDGFYKEDKIFAAIRYVIPLILIVIYVVKNNAIKKSDIVFLILVIFLLALLILNTNDYILSGKITLSIIISLSMLIVGRYMAQHTDFLKDYEPYNRCMLILIPLYIVYANIFGIGASYSNSFTAGFLITSRIYIVAIIIFMGFQYVLNNKSNTLFIKSLDIALIGINIIILAIITRRTPIGMLLLGIIIYTFLNRKIIFKMTLILFFLTLGLVLSYPLYEKKLNAQLAERERIQNLDTYESEGRYLETMYLIDHLKKTNNPMDLFFGTKLFDTTGFGEKYFGRGRGIHSDINMIIYSTGLVGMMVFAFFFGHYLLLGNGYITPRGKQLFYPLLGMFLLVLLPGRFIAIFTYAPLLMLLLSASKYSRDFRKRPKWLKKRKLVQSPSNIPYPIPTP